MAYFIRVLLTNSLSRCFGTFARFHFPHFIQDIINRTYVAIFRIDMTRFDAPVNYFSLNALFTRALRIPREFDLSPSTVISPCDSKVIECGDMRNTSLFQIKGVEYNLEDLLGIYHRVNDMRDGMYVNFYLSPRDYHRYHAPMDMSVVSATHIPGLLYPVNVPALNMIPDLYVQNERVVLECKDTNGVTFYLVYVGAMNVGSMIFGFDPHIHTNSKKKTMIHTNYSDVTFKKGDEMGYFQMGSTIVMIMTRDYMDLDISRGDTVKFGQNIGRMALNEGSGENVSTVGNDLFSGAL